MSILLLVFKIVFLLLTVAYGFSCIIRLVHKCNMPGAQIWLMSIGIVGFITLQWLI